MLTFGKQSHFTAPDLGCLGCFARCRPVVLPVWGVGFIGIVSTNPKSVLIPELLFIGLFLLFPGQEVVRGANTMRLFELSDFCHRYFVEQAAAGKTRGGGGRIFAAVERGSPNNPPFADTEARSHASPAQRPSLGTTLASDGGRALPTLPGSA